MQDSVILPQWLDNLIFEQLGAKYCRSNADMTVIDWDKNDVLNYLGTYFPRSYAESYCIFSEFFPKWPNRFINKTELSVFDFGCGTGGEIIGMLDSLHVHFPSISHVKITALDGNFHALRLLERILSAYRDKSSINIKLKVQPIVVDDLYDLSVINNIIAESYDVFMSFKAVCEFVTKERFEKDNAYGHIVKSFIPKLNSQGVMLLVDVTTYNNVSKEWLPKMLDAGITETNCSIIQRNENYNQPFVVTHSRKGNDISKITWRIIQKQQ